MKRFLVLLALIGCGNDPHEQPQVQTKIVAQQYLMNAKDLDLETIMGQLRAGKLADPGSLEQFINSQPGINNVDTDRDGKIDLISVREQEGQQTGNSVLALTAIPANGEAVVVAELSFTRNVTGQVQISGAYPSYVQGYQHHYYHLPYAHYHHSPFLSAWLWAAHRPIYYHPATFYRGRSWYSAPRPVLGGSALRTTRTTTRTTTRVGPIPKAKRPTSYQSKSKGAQRVAAKRAKVTPNTSLRGTKGQSKKYEARSTTKPKPKAGNLRNPANRSKTKPKSSSSWGSRPRSASPSRPTSRPRSVSRPSSSRSSSSRSSSRR